MMIEEMIKHYAQKNPWPMSRVRKAMLDQLARLDAVEARENMGEDELRELFVEVGCSLEVLMLYADGTVLANGYSRSECLEIAAVFFEYQKRKIRAFSGDVEGIENMLESYYLAYYGSRYLVMEKLRDADYLDRIEELSKMHEKDAPATEAEMEALERAEKICDYIIGNQEADLWVCIIYWLENEDGDVSYITGDFRDLDIPEAAQVRQQALRSFMAETSRRDGIAVLYSCRFSQDENPEEDVCEISCFANIAGTPYRMSQIPHEQVGEYLPKDSFDFGLTLLHGHAGKAEFKHIERLC